MDKLNVTVGDKVIISGRWQTSVAIVEKVTLTGRFKAGGHNFMPDGSQIGGDKWFQVVARVATQKDIERIERDNFVKEVIAQLKSVKSLTYEQAVAINQILDTEVGNT